MAEATTTAKKPSEPAVISGEEKRVAIVSSSAKAGQPPHIVLRVLIGFAGLSLLVGFFLPWLNMPASEGVPAAMLAGYNVAGDEVVGTPGAILWLIPVLGAALSAAAFMGFRWAGQVAIGVAVALIGYGLFLLMQMFVQHTALGLWIVAGGTFVILLLGVLAWLVESRRRLTPGKGVKVLDEGTAE